ncbi:MAG TPA: PadR family transcriptional regulator [Gaiellales bacterium]|nr:PadR family transcriptional regulator [Gaiellales bacterium]
MTKRRPIQPSSLGLIVLWLLVARPMHVYGMQKLIETFGKDKVVNVRSRASLYQALERLVRNGLVEVHETVRSEGYPDRVVYAVTDAGRTAAAQWLRDMLRTTGTEYPEFIAAVSVLFGLAPDDARAQLQERADRLAAELAETEAVIAETPDLPRLFLLEEEYRRAVLRAELDWVRSVVADLDAGRLTWTEDWLMGLFSEHDPMKHTQEESR